jgi:hypothetical protein
MKQMTPGQARVVDPLLTNVARGYKNAMLVGSALFPVVQVEARAGKLVAFDKSQFKMVSAAREPGENTLRVRFGHEGVPYALTQYALEGMLPVEHIAEAAATMPSLDLAAGVVADTQGIIALRLERAQAFLAQDSTKYASDHKESLGGTSRWDDSASKPAVDIAQAANVIRQSTGRRPNVLILGAAVMAALQENASIIDRVKYTGRDIVTTDLLASLFGVSRVYVGDAIQENASGQLQDLWGKTAVLAYSEIGSMAQRGTPSFGYTYQQRGYSIAEESYYGDNIKSWLYPVTDVADPFIVGADAGFLFESVVQ